MPSPGTCSCFSGLRGPELSEDRCTRTLPVGAAISCSDSGKLGCCPKALPHPLWGCHADRTAERGGQEDGYRAERGEHRPQPFTAWSLGYRTTGPGAALLSAPGSPRPPSNCGLAPGELSTGLCGGHVAWVASPWQLGGKRVRGSGACASFAVVYSDHVLSGVGFPVLTGAVYVDSSPRAGRGLWPPHHTCPPQGLSSQ